VDSAISDAKNMFHWHLVLLSGNANALSETKRQENMRLARQIRPYPVKKSKQTSKFLDPTSPSEM